MINDDGLNITAALLGGSSAPIPAYTAFGSTEITPQTTDTSIPGEFDRIAFDSIGIVNNQVTYSAIRTGATASNEYINSVGFLTSSTGGLLFSEATVASLLHTTNFDVEVINTVEVNR